MQWPTRVCALSPAPRPRAPSPTELTGRVVRDRSAPTLRTTLARILCRDPTLSHCPHDLSRCAGSFSYTVFHCRSALAQLTAPLTPPRSPAYSACCVWLLSGPCLYHMCKYALYL